MNLNRELLSLAVEFARHPRTRDAAERTRDAAERTRDAAERTRDAGWGDYQQDSSMGNVKFLARGRFSGTDLAPRYCTWDGPRMLQPLYKWGVPIMARAGSFAEADFELFGYRFAVRPDFENSGYYSY